MRAVTPDVPDSHGHSGGGAGLGKLGGNGGVGRGLGGGEGGSEGGGGAEGGDGGGCTSLQQPSQSQPCSLLAPQTRLAYTSRQVPWPQRLLQLAGGGGGGGGDGEGGGGSGLGGGLGGDGGGDGNGGGGRGLMSSCGIGQLHPADVHWNIGLPSLSASFC